MHWQEVCEHPSLKDLPFKIELNKFGKIIMSPTKLYHSYYQAELAWLLRNHLKNGSAFSECAIATEEGTKVADVAWASRQRADVIFQEVECSIAPEICIEVLSDSNTEQEMSQKRQLYFANGALEVWICDQKGQLKFYHVDGKLELSTLAPDFPTKI